jgi:hypothetical protein
MKYTALLNLAGIDDAGLSDKTDVVDWVLIEYVADWYTAPNVTRRGDKVWINYKHLISELPLLGLKTKSAVSRRFTNLAGLGLLNIERDDEGRLYAAIGQAALDARCFRSTRLPESTGVYQNERGVDKNERGGVYQNQHSLGNQISLDNQTREIEIASPAAPPNECGASTGQPIPIKPTPRPREASQGTRLPTDWMLTQELGEWALSEGLTRDRIRQEADRFRDYWIAKPGSAGRKTDWPATWRNWVRRASETKTGGDNGKAERISNFERVARDAERHLEELDRLDRIEMEQRNRAIGNGAVSPDCIAVSSQGG